jgi:predicted acetyltransferase
MTRAEKVQTQVELAAATLEQKPILANLLELYSHDFSEFWELTVGADGRFGYGGLDRYWTDADRHPFFILVDGKLAGFVFVKRGPDFFGNGTAWDMAEFFVLRAYRRRGIGMQIAHVVWRQFKGLWIVRVMQANAAAREFWKRATSAFAGEPVQSVRIEKDGEPWEFFRFESGAAS